MKKTLKSAALISAGATLLFAAFYRILQEGVFLTLAITFGTFAYHFCIRLLIGILYQSLMRNRADYRRAWYTLHGWEQKLYRFLQVKKWKGKMPTYDTAAFDPNIHSWDEIARAMCQSELVHETNILFSFFPLIAALWFGAFPIFLITGILAAVYDLLFVIMQRYNRPRIIRLVRRQESRTKNTGHA